MMKARHGPSRSLLAAAAAAALAASAAGLSSAPRAHTCELCCIFSRSNQASIPPQRARKYIMRVFIQFDVEPRGALQSLGSRRPGGRHVYIIGKVAAAPPIAARRERDGRPRGAYRAAGCVTYRPRPLRPSIFTPRAQKGTATCDWPLPRVTATARAGGRALLGAAPQLPWQQTSC